jgi:ligand-binding SRPBCC domain-containing protein
MTRDFPFQFRVAINGPESKVRSISRRCANTMYYELTDQFEVAADMDRCWQFFASAENLPLITPPWLKFSIAMPTPLPPINQDAVLDYTIRWMGFPVKWRTKIIDWSPPRQFIDLQIRGPYALWHHQHRFEPIDPAGGGGSGGGADGAAGVRCFDRVIYQLPVPLVRRVVHAAVVGKQLIEIFRYRRKIIGEHLGLLRAIQEDVEIRPLR